MSFAIKGGEILINNHYANWLDLNFSKKIIILLGLCILGVVTFGIMAKLTKAINYQELWQAFTKKGNKSA